MSKLNGFPLFENLTAQQVANIEDICELQTYAASELILKQGERSTEIYLLVAGSVSVYQTDPQTAQDLTLKVITAGQSFGELAFLDNAERICSVRAIEDCQAYVLARQQLIDHVPDYLEILGVLNTNIAHQITGSLRHISLQHAVTLQHQRQRSALSKFVLKTRSFRLRLAGFMLLLTGAALLGMGWGSWWIAYNARVAALDARLGNSLLQAAADQFVFDQDLDELELHQALRIDADLIVALRSIDTEGQVLFQSPEFPPDLVLDPLLTRLPVTVPLETVFITQRSASGHWRIGAIAFGDTRFALVVSLREIDREMRTVQFSYWLAIPVALLIVAGGAWWLSGSALHSVEQLTQAIRDIKTKELNQQIQPDIADIEFQGLIQVFNEMLTSLDRSFRQASRFSSNAAHELKTPLAILQGQLEQTMQQVEPGSAVQAQLGKLIRKVRHLDAIIRKLLLLSLADAGQMSIHKTEFSLTDLLTDMTEDLEFIATGLALTIEIEPNLIIAGDRSLMQQVIQNLIGNAIKYNLPNGWLKVLASAAGERVKLTVSNASLDIPAAEREQLFERFYRSQQDRDRSVEGTGLGLNLAREITQAHGGDLQLANTPAGQTAFVITLPRLVQ